MAMDVNDVLKNSFEKWLKTLGYAESTVYGSVCYVKDFFFYLKTIEIADIEAIRPKTITEYHKYLQTRKNKRLGGGLSNNAIIGNINALKRLGKYLQETGKPFFEINIKTKPDKETSKTILTKAEVQALYKACNNDTLGVRDKVSASNNNLTTYRLKTLPLFIN